MSFVDFAYCFGELVAQLPTVSQKAPEMRQLQTSLKPVEATRHHLQHLRRDLSTNEVIDYPLLGSISWASGKACFTACLTQPISTEVAAMGYDLQEHCWVAKYQYSVRNTFLSPDQVFSSMKACFEWISRNAASIDLGKTPLVWGTTYCFHYNIQTVLSDLPPGPMERLPPEARYVRVRTQINPEK